MASERDGAKEYKGEISSRQGILKRERETIAASQVALEEKSQDLLNLAESETKRTLENFKELHQFLYKQEKYLLSEIEEVRQEIQRSTKEHKTRLNKESLFLEGFIQKMEVKRQKLASEHVKDVRSNLQGFENKRLNTSWAFPKQLQTKLSRIQELDQIIENTKQAFKCSSLFQHQLQEANVTLNAETAHPDLIVSEDRKSVRREAKPQAIIVGSSRFSDRPCVLGWQGFTSGRHFWEVNVESGEGWALGVARKSVVRNGCFPISPKAGIWAVEMWGGNYWALTSPDSSPLSLREKPRRIRVTLDYEGGRVSFSNADSGAELYMFSGAFFNGEILLPFFHLWGYQTHLSIC